MQCIMTNTLALHFNVYGRNGKQPFGKSRIFNVVNLDMGQFLAARFAQPQPVDGEVPNQEQEATWWCRLLARVVGTLAGVVGIISGLLAVITLNPICIASGLLLLLAAVIVLVFEAPICCTFIEITKPIAAFAEKRTFFQKAIIYVVIAIIPFALCYGLSTLFGCLLIFATGVFYGLMALGRKADRHQMMTAAAATDRPVDQMRADDTQVGLIGSEDPMRMDSGNPYGNIPPQRPPQP